jgi:hypothetical protein
VLGTQEALELIVRVEDSSPSLGVPWFTSVPSGSIFGIVFLCDIMEHFYFWILPSVACIIRIVGNTVPRNSFCNCSFLLFLTAATCFGLYLTIFRWNIQFWFLEIAVV